MARYTGPKSKIARRFGEAILGPSKALSKKNYPPGQHGPSKRRGKQSEYAVQLMEKQKAKYTYGILERQFANMFDKASRMKGITGENLLQLCEARLDNMVYRFGISPSRRGARQLVSHKLILVNGVLVNIPSFVVRVGDVDRTELFLQCRNAGEAGKVEAPVGLGFNAAERIRSYAGIVLVNQGYIIRALVGIRCNKCRYQYILCIAVITTGIAIGFYLRAIRFPIWV